MASLRADKEERREYLVSLAESAFWHDEEVKVTAIEAIMRSE